MGYWWIAQAVANAINGNRNASLWHGASRGGLGAMIDVANVVSSARSTAQAQHSATDSPSNSVEENTINTPSDFYNQYYGSRGGLSI